MRNTNFFWGTAVISVLFMQFALGEYVKKTAPDEDKDQPKFTPRPTKPLPIPQKKQDPQKASSTVSQQRTRPIPPPKPANLSVTPPQTVRKPLPIAPNPFDTPLTEKEREAAAKDTDNPFANVLRPATTEAEKQAPSTARQVVDTNMDLTKSSAAELKQIREKAVAEFNAIDAKEPNDRTPTEDKRYGELGAFFQRMGEEIAKKENAAETVTTTQWQRATPVGIEEKRKADEQAAKAAEQAAKFKEVADRLQPKQLTIWEKIKQGATAVKETFLGSKPTVEISAPTNFRKLSTEEAAAKAQADINAAKTQAANTAAQEKERTAIQKLGTKIIDQINIFTAKISGPRAPTSAESASIKGAITGFVDSVRNKFATATQPMRKTVTAQLDSITRNLNLAIAKIPVNSPQRKEFLTSKGMINLSKLYGTSERVTKAVQDSKLSTAEKLMARTDFFVALETLKRNPQSTSLGLTQETSSAFAEKIRTLIQSNTKPDFQKQIEAAKKEAVALTAQEKELTEQLREIRAELSTARDFVEGAGGSDKATQQRLKDNAAALEAKLDEASKKLAAHQAKQAELADSVKQAEEALKTHATKMQKADAALSSAKRNVAGAASDLGRSIAKLPASARSLGATLKAKAATLANAIKTGTPAAKIAALRKDLSGALTTFKNKAKGKASKKVIQNVGVNVEEMVREAAEVQKQQEEKARVNAEAAVMASDQAAETTKP